jgi:hypothetical protein
MVVAINPPQQAFSRERTDPRDNFERDMDKLLRALQIANAGFGIAVDFKKIQNMPTSEEAAAQRELDRQFKKAQIGQVGAETGVLGEQQKKITAETGLLPTSEEATSARQSARQKISAEIDLVNQQAAKIKAEINALEPAQRAEKLKGLDDHVQKFIKKSQIYKEGEAEVIGGKSLSDLSELARNGNQQALGLMKVSAARAKQGGQLTDKDIELTGQNRQIALAFKRFYNERIAGKVQVEDVNDLMDLGDNLMSSGFEKISNARRTLAAQRAKTTPYTEAELMGAATVEELVGFSPQGFLRAQERIDTQKLDRQRIQPGEKVPSAQDENVEKDVDEFLKARRRLGR